MISYHQQQEWRVVRQGQAVERGGGLGHCCGTLCVQRGELWMNKNKYCSETLRYSSSSTAQGAAGDGRQVRDESGRRGVGWGSVRGIYCQPAH